MTSRFDAQITKHFHGKDGHGFTGVIDKDGLAVVDFINFGNDSFAYNWSSGDIYLEFLREGLSKYPISDYREVVKQHLLDLLMKEDLENVNSQVHGLL
jgi:hypothetical protein